MAMLGHVKWDKFLSPDSKCPPDVFFIFKGEDGQSVKIGAHRLLLAGVSEVFANTFFGPMKNSEEEVEVKNTSPEAFQLLINFVYSHEARLWSDGSNGIIDKITSPKLLVELFGLGDYYGVDEKLQLKTTLMEKLKRVYKPFVTRENYIESALVARNYKEIFPEMARELQMKSLQVHLATKDRNFPEDLLLELMEVAKTVLQLSDWGNLACFDSIGPNRSSHTIPKLSSQWMISFKRSSKYGSLTIETQGIKALIMESFIHPKSWRASFKMGHQVEVEVGIPNETGDSVSMELIHLKEGEDSYSLTVNVDGLEVGKTSCCSISLRNLTDVSITCNSGFTGDLIVLDKA